MNEQDLQNAVVRVASMLGWRTYHTYDSRKSDPGFPDLIMVRGPKLVAVEFKTEKGRVSVVQREWLEALMHAGVQVYVWRPADLDDEIPRVLKR